MSERSPRALTPHAPHAPSPAREDPDLVRECLDGNQEAWRALIAKYKNLIYSIPLKYHATPQDAADIFQLVCLDLFNELKNLRKTESLRSWLITVAIHKSYQWKKKEQRWATHDLEESVEKIERAAARLRPSDRELAGEAEREQMVREALDRLQGRCQEMIRLLFFSDPPLPYNEVAQRLGLATGSIGFIRGRCLKKLQSVLEDMGFS